MRRVLLALSLVFLVPCVGFAQKPNPLLPESPAKPIRVPSWKLAKFGDEKGELQASAMTGEFKDILTELNGKRVQFEGTIFLVGEKGESVHLLVSHWQGARWWNAKLFVTIPTTERAFLVNTVKKEAPCARDGKFTGKFVFNEAKSSIVLEASSYETWFRTEK